MSDNTCAIGACQKPARQRGWCSMHYERWRTRGTTDPRPPFKPAPCSVPDCGASARRNGLCGKHSQRAKKHGDPLTVVQIKGNNEARFLQYVNKQGPIPPSRPELGRCWIWTGVRHRTRGYGRFYVGGRGGRYMQAHRWSYERFAAPIPAGLTIDHLCRTTPCVNPLHLEPVTQAENNRRAAQAR